MIDTDAGPIAFDGTRWSGPRTEGARVRSRVRRGQRSRRPSAGEGAPQAACSTSRLGADDVKTAARARRLADRPRRELLTEKKPARDRAADDRQGRPDLSLEGVPRARADRGRPRRARRSTAAAADAELGAELRLPLGPGREAAGHPTSIGLGRPGAALVRDSAVAGEELGRAPSARHAGKEAWIRRAASTHAGDDCPFCGRSLARYVSSSTRSAAWFDQLVSTTTPPRPRRCRSSALGRIAAWWKQVEQVGRANADAFAAWNDLDAPRPPQPSLDSTRRRADLTAALDDWPARVARRQAPGPQPRDRAAARLASLDALAAAYDATAAAARDYECAAPSRRSWRASSARIATRPRKDPAALRRELRRIDASVARHTEDMIEAAQERARSSACAIRTRRPSRSCGRASPLPRRRGSARSPRASTGCLRSSARGSRSTRLGHRAHPPARRARSSRSKLDDRGEVHVAMLARR